MVQSPPARRMMVDQAERAAVGVAVLRERAAQERRYHQECRLFKSSSCILASLASYFLGGAFGHP